jgi:hypothetical protein
MHPACSDVSCTRALLGDSARQQDWFAAWWGSRTAVPRQPVRSRCTGTLVAAHGWRSLVTPHQSGAFACSTALTWTPASSSLQSKLPIRWIAFMSWGRKTTSGGCTHCVCASSWWTACCGKRQGLADSGSAHWSGGHRPQRLRPTHLAHCVKSQIQPVPAQLPAAVDRAALPVASAGHTRWRDRRGGRGTAMQKLVLRVFLNAPIKKLIFVDGAANPTGDVCAGRHCRG